MTEKIDLKVRIGTKTEVFWTDLQTKMEESIESAEREIVINKHIILLAKEKIAKEQKHLNTSSSIT